MRKSLWKSYLNTEVKVEREKYATRLYVKYEWRQLLEQFAMLNVRIVSTWNWASCLQLFSRLFHIILDIS